MKARLIAVIAVALSIIGLVVATSVNDPNYGLNLSATAGSGSFHLSWWGEAGKTYYIQHSVNLTDWSYVAQAGIFQGNSEPIEVDVQSNGERGFFKLVITENNSLPGEWLSSYGLDPTTPADVDSDGDGLTNAQEYALGTNPNNADTDGDGFPDGDETTSGSDPNDVNSKPPPVTGAVVVQTRWVTILKEDNTPPAASYYFSEEEGGNHPAGWYRDISYNGGDGGSNIRSRWISNEGSGEWEDGPVPSNVPSLSSLNFTGVSESAPLEGTSADSPRISDYGFVDYIPPSDGPGSWDRTMPHIVNGTNTQAHTTTTLQTEVRLHREPPDSTSTNVIKPAVTRAYAITHEINETFSSVEASPLTLAAGATDSNSFVLAPTVEPNTRKKDSAKTVEIFPVSTDKGRIGDMVPSNHEDGTDPNAPPERHFVTPKKSTYLSDTHVSFRTTLTDEEFGAGYEWEGGENYPGSPSWRKVSRADTDHIVLKLNYKNGGGEAARINVWIVWCDVTVQQGSPEFRAMTASTPVTRWAYHTPPTLGSVWRFVFTIQPASIITEDERPYLESASAKGGDKEVPGFNKDWVTDPTKVGDSAQFKWDITRKMKITVRNQGGISKADLGTPAAFFANQPLAVDIPVTAPTNDVEGNDDPPRSLQDTNAYYKAASDPLVTHEKGQMCSVDGPSFSVLKSWGAANRTYGVEADFQEFARLQIWDTKRSTGTYWFRVSDFTPWHHYLKTKFNSTTGEWEDDGSSAGQ